MTTQNRTSLLAADQKMIDGVQKNLSGQASFTVGSQKLTPADIVKVFQDRLSTAKAADAAEAARTAAVKANRDKRAQTAPVVRALKRIVEGMFMQSPEVLAEFGLTAPKAGKATVAVKATAAIKNKATRVARSTRGSKQRKLITGTVVPGASTGPAPEAPAHAATPAAPATATTPLTPAAAKAGG